MKAIDGVDMLVEEDLMLWMNGFKPRNSLMGGKYSLDYAF